MGRAVKSGAETHLGETCGPSVWGLQTRVGEAGLAWGCQEGIFKEGPQPSSRRPVKINRRRWWERGWPSKGRGRENEATGMKKPWTAAIRWGARGAAAG